MITSNHEVILGDQPRKIEVAADGSVVSSFQKEFKIDGKDSGASAIVFLMVKGLVGQAEAIDVDINGKGVGQITPNPQASPDAWFTQMIHFSASEGSLAPNRKTDTGTNTIQIPGKDSTPKEGKFYVQNIVILYKAIFE